MKIDGNCIKCLASVLKQRHFHTNLHLTNSAANENFMYALEPDALPVKQHVARERIKESGVAGGDPWAPVRESADRVWKDWGMLIF
jgi:hypothetical protein